MPCMTAIYPDVLKGGPPINQPAHDLAQANIPAIDGVVRVVSRFRARIARHH